MKQSDYSSYILPIGALVIAYLVLKRFGIVKDTQKETTETGQLFKDYFSPNFLQSLYSRGGRIQLLTQQQADQIATDLYKSKGVFSLFNIV